MKKIDWKKIAKQHDMSYAEFGKELMGITTSYMLNEMEVENQSKIMIVKYDDITLTCERLR